MSVRPDVSPTSVSLTTSTPPATTRGAKRAWDGGLRTTAASASSTIGEPIGSSPTMTVQEAVPPRISGP